MSVGLELPAYARTDLIASIARNRLVCTAIREGEDSLAACDRVD